MLDIDIDIGESKLFERTGLVVVICLDDVLIEFSGTSTFYYVSCSQ